ncbi:M48 family metalloprotease [Paenibacillus sp. SC116]|uniref:M56 family metallopeptidase n=1 Tax=Paenibacillus sp. SC116 TaxID=2968986 RepID=UPI00215A81C2|nr:M56 family metallopeptidase [Paenibacillus sp. SC116]MCR8846395.1 M48 family metalloprotease [Paenibacillus sp. SC116]
MSQFILLMQQAFEWIIETTIMASLLVILIILIKAMLRNKLSPRWHYLIWLAVGLRLILPWAPESSFSIYNLLLFNNSIETPAANPSSMESSKDSSHATITTNTTVPLITHEAKNQSPAVTSPDITSPESAPEPTSIVTKSTPLGEEPHHVPTSLPSVPSLPSAIESKSIPFSWFDVAFFLWLSGVTVFTSFFVFANVRIYRLIYKQPVITDAQLVGTLEQCKQKMSISRNIPLVLSENLPSPALFGFIRPRIILNQAVIDSLSSAQLPFVFLHELAHLKRKDVLVNACMYAMLILHWFNPILWYAYKRMREDQEMACDSLALSYIQEEQKFEYGHTIISLLQPRPFRLSNLTQLSGNKKELKKRILTIANYKPSNRRSVVGVIALVLICSLTLTNANVTANVDKNLLQTKELNSESSKDSINRNFTSWLADKKLNTEHESVRLGAAAGLSVPITEAVTDQGVTLRFKEVYADANVVGLHYRVEQPDGTLLPVKYDTTGLKLVDQEIIDRWYGTFKNFDPSKMSKEIWYYDEQGELAVLTYWDWDWKRGIKGGPFYLTNTTGKIVGHSQYQDKNEGVVFLSVLDKASTDPLLFHVNLTRIGHVKGNWKRSFSIDRSLAASSTRTIPVSNSYTHNSGIQMKLNAVDLLPSSAKFNFELQNVDEELIDVHTVFDVKDKQGKVRTQLYTSTADYYSFEIQNEKLKPVQKWSGSIFPMKQWLTEPFTLELKSIMTVRPINFQIPTSIAKLQHEPVQTEKHGVQIKLSTVQMKKEEAERFFADDIKNRMLTPKLPDKLNVLKIEQEYPKDIWVNSYLQDIQGNMLYSSDLYLVDWKEGAHSNKSTTYYYFNDLKDTAQLTFQMDQLTKTYEDVNWEIPIDPSKK